MSETFPPTPDYARYGRPTTHRGVQMRSRLEATAAAALDCHRLPWKYEPECFSDPEGQYLPDFLVGPPGAEWYVEVKPRSILSGVSGNEWTWSGHLPEHRTVPMVQRAMRRLRTIHASLPRARLALWIPDAGRMALLNPNNRRTGPRLWQATDGADAVLRSFERWYIDRMFLGSDFDKHCKCKDIVGGERADCNSPRCIFKEVDE